jgi:two-component system LytT family sensor kinase
MTLTGRLAQNRDTQFWILQLAGWSGWVLLFSLRDAYWGQPFENLGVLIVDAAAGALLTTMLRYIYQRVWERPVKVRVLTVIVMSYVAAAIWQPIKNLAQLYQSDGSDMFVEVQEYGILYVFNGIIGYSYFLMLCWSVLYFALKFYQLLQDERQRSIRAESLAHEAQLRMLRYQLNPHFLFNTLNAVSTLILSNETRSANSMVSKLSNFLRYTLDNDPMQKVTLAHEISTLRLYLDIEKVRFTDRLQFEAHADEVASEAMVPSLLLQPLIENAVKYAITQREEGGRIGIRGRVEGAALVLRVEDDGPGMPITDGRPERQGVGLANIEQRLAALYPGRHSLVFCNEKPGLGIEIRIPFERRSA